MWAPCVLARSGILSFCAPCGLPVFFHVMVWAPAGLLLAFVHLAWAPCGLPVFFHLLGFVLNH